MKLSALSSLPSTLGPAASGPALPAGPADTLGPSVEPGPKSRQDLIRELLEPSFKNQEFYVRWQARVGGRLLAEPAVAADGSTAMVNDESLVVLGPDGTPRWSAPHPEGGRFKLFWPPCFTPDGGVLAPTEDGLRCYDASGNQVWHQAIGDMRTPPAVDGDGNVYAAGSGGRLFSFAPDGSPRWTCDLAPQMREVHRGERREWAEKLRQDLGKPDLDPGFRSWLEKTLAEAEQQVASPDAGYEGPPKITGGPSLSPDGKVYCFTETGPFFRLDRDGNSLEQLETPGALQDHGVAFTPEGGVLAVTWNSLLAAWKPDGTPDFQYGGFAEARLDRLSAEKQDEARRAGNVGASTVPCLSPDGQAVYFAGMDGKVRAVDRSGNKLWTRAMEGRDSSSVGVAVGSDGTVYGANPRGLTAFSPDGRVLWSYETSQKYAHLAVRGHEVILTTYGGDVYCLDADHYRRMAESAVQRPGGAAPSRIEVGDGWVTIGGVTLEQRS